MSPNPPVVLKPLLRQTAFLPGESLPSLLARLLILNGYPAPSTLEKLYLPQKPDNPDCPRLVETYERLSTLTGLPAAEIWAASDRRLSHATWEPAQNDTGFTRWNSKPSFLGIQRGFFRPTQAAQFCPQCLAESAYHRLAWRPAAMAICQAHNRLLMTACQYCGKPVSIAEIVRTRCSGCQADLRQMNSAPIPIDTWGSFTQQILWNWLLDENTTENLCGWPQQPAWILCSLAQGLAWGVLSRPAYFLPVLPFPESPAALAAPGAATLAELRPAQLYWAYANALHWMVDWPDRFREFLQLYAPHGNAAERSLGCFYLDWIECGWKSHVFDFIHEELQRFWSDQAIFASASAAAPSPIAPVFAYAIVKDAVPIAKIPETALMRLAQLGILHTYSLRYSDYFLRRELRQLRHEWRGWLSLQDAALWLGISPDTVSKLSQTPVLRAQTLPGLNGYEARMVSRSSVARLLDKIDRHATGISSFFIHNELWSLQQAAEDLACLGLDEAFLLEAVFHGRLRACRAEGLPDEWDVATIFFGATNVTCLAKEVLAQRGWLEASEAAYQMFLTDEELEQLVDLGLLGQTLIYHRRRYLQQQEFSLFKEQFISASQVGYILRVSSSEVLQCIQQTQWNLVSIRESNDWPLYLLPRERLPDLAQLLEHFKSR